MSAKVLIVGQGAREHALAWRLSGEGAEVVCAPGNGGTEGIGRSLPLAVTDVDGFARSVAREQWDLAVIGPEAPLAAGLADRLRDAGVAVFGPGARASRLEASKVFSKELMARAGIPTAAFCVFDDPDRAIEYVRAQSRPLVVKADGLAAGKGVVVAQDVEEATRAIETMMVERAFGEAGRRIVIEDVLVGEEVSYHVISDGERYVALATAQDHKRVFEGDRGPNTGGMGAYSPAPVVTPTLERAIRTDIVEPTLKAVASEGEPFRGALFLGLMIVDGKAMVLEYNVRFGDPECQALMARWGGSLLTVLAGAATGRLPEGEVPWEAPASVAVVLASAGYPGAYRKGLVIHGLDRAEAVDGVRIFHAGTVRHEGGAVRTAGGRVLTVAAVGQDIDQACDRAYGAADLIGFEGKFLRKDIGWRVRRTQ